MNQPTKNTERFKLLPLTPLDKNDDERVKKYVTRINDALEIPDVKNLALTGVYGSGKSTILKSYQSKYNDKRFLSISLSSFNETEEYKNFKDQIQLTILQQILYSQDSKKLPDSRISRIREIDVWSKNHIQKVFVLISFLASTYSILNYFKSDLNPNNWDSSLSFNWWSFFALVAFLISSFFLGQYLIKTLSNSKINKVNIKGDIEVADEVKHKDFLNKYIDEILYFFEKTHIDVVIIQDLDRFNTTEIYRTLREINFILNTFLKNTKGDDYKKVVFIYAIKDELFSNELERTKFFDLIIPVLPFVNSHNSKNKLKQELNKLYVNEDDLFKHINNTFINEVSSFIKDNRILLNIINEFAVYKELLTIQEEELNPNNLLAIIIYKNLYPSDFSLLHNNDSLIDKVFSNYKKLIIKNTSNLNEEVQTLERDIEDANGENLYTISELNTIYTHNIKKLLPIANYNNSNDSNSGLYIEDTPESFENIVNNSINLYKIKGNFKFYSGSYGVRNSNVKINDVDNKINSNYLKRYQNIINNDYLKNLNSSLSEKKRILNELNNYDLSTTIKEFNLLSLEELKNTKQAELLFYFLREGYINEDFKKYFSIYQKGGLTENDEKFNQNVFSNFNSPLAVDYKLDDVITLIEEIGERHFNNDRILNLQIVDTLAIHSQTFRKKFNFTLSTIECWSSRSQNFFLKYLYNGKQIELFIKELASNWDDLWIQTSSTFKKSNSNDLNQLLYYLIKYVPLKTIKNLNKNNSLKEYIEDNLDEFYGYDDIKEAKIHNIYNGLEIKFSKITTPKSSKGNKFIFILENNFYKINYNNIGVILEDSFDTKFDKKKIETSNLSYVYESKISKLIDYLESDNYQTYFSNVYPKLDNNQYDSSDVFLKIINNEQIKEDDIQTFLEKQKTKLENLSDVKVEENFSSLFIWELIKHTWKNVLFYYNNVNKELDDILIEYLNEEEPIKKLSESKINLNEEYDKEFYESFNEKLILNNSIEIENYRKLLKSTLYSYGSSLEYEKLDEGKVVALIKNNIISFNQDNFEKLKSNFSSSHLIFLEFYQIDLLCDFSQIILDIDDKEQLLKSNNINFELKELIADNISVVELNSNNNLLNLIFKIAIKSENLNLSFEKIELLVTNNTEVEDNLSLIFQYGNHLNKNELIKLLKILPNVYNEMLNSTQIKLPKTQINLELIKLLQSKDIVSSFKEKKDELNIYMKKLE